MFQKSANPGAGRASGPSRRSSPSKSALVIRISETPVTIAGSRDSGSFPLMIVISAGVESKAQPFEPNARMTIAMAENTDEILIIAEIGEGIRNIENPFTLRTAIRGATDSDSVQGQQFAL